MKFILWTITFWGLVSLGDYLKYSVFKVPYKDLPVSDDLAMAMLIVWIGFFLLFVKNS